MIKESYINKKTAGDVLIMYDTFEAFGLEGYDYTLYTYVENGVIYSVKEVLMKDIEATKDFKLSVIEHLKSIGDLIYEDDKVEFGHLAELIESDFDYLLSRLSHSEEERFSEN